MTQLILAALVLGVIIWASLRLNSLTAKALLFLGMGGCTGAYLYLTGGQVEHTVLHHVFVVDYPQFIGIPLVTVLIASMGLFTLRLPKDVKVGWFLLVALPIIGNFATTWAVTPIALSLIPHLRETYPKRWVLITITICTFSANFMAMATLLADPPQAYWAIKAAAAGNPLDFFFPLTQFWPYLAVTWVLYALVLRHLGVQFGALTEMIRLRPESWAKFALGLGFAGSIAYALTQATGYGVTAILGGVFVAGLLIARFAFGHDEWHNTKHWATETATIFVAFFSVVAFAHAGLHHVQVPDLGMIAAIIGMTLGADNAAAFAAGYEKFVQADQAIMVWYNLFNSISYGGLSPLGNGPQIVLFLVILVGMEHVSVGQVFREWGRMGLVLAPYLLVWTGTSYYVVSNGGMMDPFTQFVTGFVAITFAMIWMRQSSEYLPYLDAVRHHSRPSRKSV